MLQFIKGLSLQKLNLNDDRRRHKFSLQGELEGENCYSEIGHNGFLLFVKPQITKKSFQKTSYALFSSSKHNKGPCSFEINSFISTSMKILPWRATEYNFWVCFWKGSQQFVSLLWLNIERIYVFSKTFCIFSAEQDNIHRLFREQSV